MSRNPKAAKKTPGRKPRPVEGKGRVRRGRPKVCRFCAEHSVWVDYKDVNLLRRFMNDRGRIKSRGATGTCAQHQRDVAAAIKTARELALLPYVVRTVAADSGDRRGGGRRGQGRMSGSDEVAASDAGEDEPDNDEAGAIDPDAVSDAAEGSEANEASDSPTPGNETAVATS
jgi:small subunit ribosomal protein S18